MVDVYYKTEYILLQYLHQFHPVTYGPGEMTCEQTDFRLIYSEPKSLACIVPVDKPSGSSSHVIPTRLH